MPGIQDCLSTYGVLVAVGRCGNLVYNRWAYLIRLLLLTSVSDFGVFDPGHHPLDKCDFGFGFCLFIISRCLERRMRRPP